MIAVGKVLDSLEKLFEINNQRTRTRHDVRFDLISFLVLGSNTVIWLLNSVRVSRPTPRSPHFIATHSHLPLLVHAMRQISALMRRSQRMWTRFWHLCPIHWSHDEPRLNLQILFIQDDNLLCTNKNIMLLVFAMMVFVTRWLWLMLAAQRAPF